MKNSYRNVALFLGLLFLSVLIWNLFLMNEIAELNSREKEMELKIQTLRGDLDIYNYDLITSRDSVRILNLELEKCP